MCNRWSSFYGSVLNNWGSNGWSVLMKNGMKCVAYGEYIRVRAKELGLNQLEVARRSGLSRRPIYRAAEGHPILTPSPDELIALAKVLDTSVVTLLEKLGYRERKELNGGVLCLLRKGSEALLNIFRRRKRAKRLNW